MRNDETKAGHSNGATRGTLARYQEWHNQSRDVADAGSVYTMLAAYALTARIGTR